MLDFLGALLEFSFVFSEDEPSRGTRIVRAVIIWLILFIVLSATVAAGLNTSSTNYGASIEYARFVDRHLRLSALICG